MSAPVEGDIDELVKYMLFADEAPLKEPIEGVSTFTSTFPKRGPRDRQGRSLRDFDLQTRLFRYPLSYMIYSPVFDALPSPVQERSIRSSTPRSFRTPVAATSWRFSPIPSEDCRPIGTDVGQASVGQASACGGL